MNHNASNDGPPNAPVGFDNAGIHAVDEIGGMTPGRGVSRREFLGQSGAAILGGTLGATLAGGGATGYSIMPPGVIGANERINFALIGYGQRGINHLARLKQLERLGKSNVRLAAICEIYERRKEIAMRLGGLPSCHHNYEDVLANKEVDALIICVPDHWHRKMSIDTMAAGKDVYCEKPMTLTWEEAKEVTLVQKLTGRVFQVGAQSASQERWMTARRLLGDGKSGPAGKVLQFQTSYNRNVPNGDWNYAIHPDASPKTIDWDRFLGPAPRREFDPERFFRFRKFWDYSGGLATDLLYHQLSHMLVTLGFPFAKRVAATGGNYVHFDREVPDTFTVLTDLENGCTGNLLATSGNDTEMQEMIRCQHGTITFPGSDVLFTPQNAFQEAIRARLDQIPDAEIREEDKGGRRVISSIRLASPPWVNDSDLHLDKFIHSMRTGEKPLLDAEAGYRIMTTISLAIKSYRENRVCLFDPVKQELV